MPQLTDVSPFSYRRIKATRRQFLRGATGVAASPNAISAGNGPNTDPVIALIANEKRWRLLAMTARARAERLLFALPKNEWPEEFDDHPVMAEALSLEKRADEVYDRIIETPARTLQGIFAKLERSEGDAEVTEAAIADLRLWLRAQS
jgi:hypothetical protein